MKPNKPVAPDAAEKQAEAPTEGAQPAQAGRKTLGVKPQAERGDAQAKPGVRARFLGREERQRGLGRPQEARPVPAPAPPPAPQKPRSTRSGRPAVAPKARVTAPAAPAGTVPAEGVRLSKVMADRGLCSRREADAMIERGWVFVDGRCISELGTRIDPAAEITLSAHARQRQAEQVTILLHKPVGYVSGQPEPGYEPAVSLIGAGNQFDREQAPPFEFSHLKGLAPAGRLDIDSTGLLVLTQDGRVARQLIGDDSKVDKEYLVRVEGELDERGLALLNHGLELDGRKLRPAKVEWINADQLRFVLREGRKRQIRRMCELVGLKVVGLKRIRIGRVRLGDLPLGQWRFLREDERF